MATSHEILIDDAMKHAELKSIVHNVADSIGSGLGFLIGLYRTDIYQEARASTGQTIVLDLLLGKVVEGEASETFNEAANLYKDAFAKMVSEAGGSTEKVVEATIRFRSSAANGPSFSITVEDAAGIRTITDYQGVPAKRVKELDALGRIRPKNIAR